MADADNQPLLEEVYASGLGLWRCRRGHIDVVFDGFTRQQCGAKDGLHRDGWCREPGQQLPGWVVVPPEEAERLGSALNVQAAR